MRIEALTGALEAEGRQQATELRREAAEEAVRIHAEAEEAVARRVAEALRLQEVGLRREGEVRLAGVRREARARVLAEREAFLERVFDAARRAFPRDLEDPQVRRAFVRRLRRALPHLTGTVVVRCAPDLAAAARDALPEGSEARVEPDPELEAEPGFRALAADGAVEVEATLPRLLERHRPHLAIGVLRDLERDRAGPP